MPNLNAALGCAQLEQMESFVRSKRALHLVYKEAFRRVSEGVELMKEPEGARSNFWLQALLLQPEFALIRDSILSLTNSAGCIYSTGLDSVTSTFALYVMPPNGFVGCCRLVRAPH